MNSKKPKSRTPNEEENQSTETKQEDTQILDQQKERLKLLSELTSGCQKSQVKHENNFTDENHVV